MISSSEYCIFYKVDGKLKIEYLVNDQTRDDLDAVMTSIEELKTISRENYPYEKKINLLRESLRLHNVAYWIVAKNTIFSPVETDKFITDLRISKYGVRSNYQILQKTV